MFKLGYAISSEEHHPSDIIRHAQAAEEAGFRFALISDHFHPWISEQGQSPFVWAVLGGLAQSTHKMHFGTGVTCPIIRIHPAIIAQATATVAAMMPGRFFFGIGTGENLNEHILADRWPPYAVRTEMLEEAVEVIRLLWQGDMQSYEGKHYIVENARIYTLPDELPPIMFAAGGPESAALAGRLGDGLISTTPEKEIVQTFENHGSTARPKYGQVKICWAASEAEARQTAHKYWPTSALRGDQSQELPTPGHFERAVKGVSEDEIAESILCSNNPQKHLDAIQKFVDAGFDHIYVHQIGPDQEGFFKFYTQTIFPELSLAETV